MATFSDYDEERRLISGFGEFNVSWQGGEWAVRYEGKVFRVPTGLVTKHGIREIKKAMKEIMDGGSQENTEASEGERL